MANRRLGRVKQERDDRDRVFQVGRRMTASLPSLMNLGANMPMQIDQGDEGACGPNSMAEIIMFDQKVEYIPVALPSRNFIYYNCRVLMNTVSSDSGVDNRTLMKSMAKYGWCAESTWAYTDADMFEKPSQDAYKAAVINCISDYAAVGVNQLQMKGCIAQGIPFLFGFDVYDGMMTDETAATGLMPMPAPGQTPIGGHDVTAYGYDDAKQLLRCRNHWINDDGTPWGDKGDVLIPYAFAFNPNYVSDLWMLRTIPGARPAPVGPIVAPVVPSPKTGGTGTTLTPGSYLLVAGNYNFQVT